MRGRMLREHECLIMREVVDLGGEVAGSSCREHVSRRKVSNDVPEIEPNVEAPGFRLKAGVELEELPVRLQPRLERPDRRTSEAHVVPDDVVYGPRRPCAPCRRVIMHVSDDAAV